ncbi:MAG TPA: FAD/NAD(P)-binding protein, partial [Trebonia sp.]|nr:FAD/NAD(P)-binding protein [Trebonia sp.]
DGILDVPFCLHQDNAGVARSMIDDTGRLAWARTGAMPVLATRSPVATVTSERLIGMLRHTARAHDHQAALSRDAATVPVGEVPFRIAIVGSGPRGLAVTERLAARLAAGRPGREVEIAIIDKVHVGAGRVWRPDQDESFLMNTPCDEVTMFSGPPGEGPARAGAGPSLGQWLAGVGAETGAFAPRAVYGRYLSFCLDAVEAYLPASVILRRVRGEVTAVEPAGTGWRLSLSGAQTLSADRVVLATGHPVTEIPADQNALSGAGASYIRGDCAADMPLATIAPGSTVAVIGMGLTFYDVMAALTTGRGGRFSDDGQGGLRYVPSGREPVLVAGSRSGLPVPARGLNQKSPGWRYAARLFTPRRIAALREAGPLDFRADVWPWLNAEMQLVYYATAVRGRRGTEAEREVADAVVRDILTAGASAAESVARDHARRAGADLDALGPLDVDRLARPFAGARFGTAGEFTARLSAAITEDIAEARLGNYHGPRKAALDVLRDTRGTIRAAVDYGGLTATSHRRHFLGWFVPLSSFLAAGPPLFRLQETLALLDAGILEIAGPSTRFTAAASGRFTVSSPQVAASERECDLLLDARIPAPDIQRDQAPLARQLTGSGLWTSWANRSGGEPLDTGGVAVTDAPYHPVSAVGGAVDGLYVLGIPAEGPRWFMQVGSARPGPWTQFTADADAIAADILAHVSRGRAPVALRAGQR